MLATLFQQEPAGKPGPSNDLSLIVDEARELAPMTSLLVWHRDSLVTEAYFRGGAPNRVVNVKSASKSILSSLVGIAFAEGILDSLDQPLAALLPEYFQGMDSTKRSLTIRHAMTMQTGLESTSFSNYGAWASSPDWVRFQLEQPWECTPGTCWGYSTGTSHLMAVILARASGISLLEYARTRLFNPLGIPLSPWDRDPQGHYLGGNNMAMRAGDLVKYGRLHLNSGRWGGSQLIPPEWIEAAWGTYGVSPYNGNGYGYYWWNRESAGEAVYFAWGYGGQFVFVVPRLELVVVTTADLNNRPTGVRHNRNVYQLLDRIVPLIRRRHPTFGPMAR